MKGVTIWFTGLSGSGKTTIANEFARRLRNENIGAVILDGDVVRKTLSSDLGYSKEERDKHITRVAQVSQLISQNGVINIACVISPTKKIREMARGMIDDFIEVYIKCPIETCEERDVQGHYARVRSGEIKEFVGITVPYEEPENPDLIIDTSKIDLNESVKLLMDYVQDFLKTKNL